MSDFYRTRMGHTFFNQTLPEIARQLRRLNELLERLVASQEGGKAKNKPTPADK